MEADKSHSAVSLVSQKDSASRAWKYSLCYLLLKKKNRSNWSFFLILWFFFFATTKKTHMLGNWNASADLSSVVFVGFSLITKGSRSLKVISLVRLCRTMVKISLVPDDSAHRHHVGAWLQTDAVWPGAPWKRGKQEIKTQAINSTSTTWSLSAAGMKHRLRSAIMQSCCVREYQDETNKPES